MAIATTFSRAQLGVDAPLVIIEADVSPGLPNIIIVGLPETAVREAKDRVKAAIINSGFKIPMRRITINMAPADLPKQGGRYDLAIALAVLGASGQIPMDKLYQREFLGELSLDGKLRSVAGVLPATMHNRATHRLLVVPADNQQEACLAQNQQVRMATHLKDIVLSLQQDITLAKPKHNPGSETQPQVIKISDIRGQYLAKRALIIAAAGGHNLLFVGPPGTGKTMLASRLASLLPAMTPQEALAAAAIHSVSKYQFSTADWGKRPFRSPHHTASAVALVGGGNPPKPGEISLAHHGVLFLDELPEFPRHVLEVLREPLESGRIVISRAHHQVTYAARFQLVSAMNPCPCGYLGDDTQRCGCRRDQVERYLSRVSGPLMDRIDLHVDVPALPKGTLSKPLQATGPEEHLDAVQKISTARTTMLNRSGALNAYLNNQQIDAVCPLNSQDRTILDDAMSKLGLSARGYYKVLKIARTIADLVETKQVTAHHLIEALSFRRLDKYRQFT